MALPAGTHNVNYQKDMAIVRTRFQWVALLLGIALVACFPLFIGAGWICVINQIFCVIIAVIGLQILTGYSGQISLGQAAFMAVGAYTYAILSAQFQLPFLIALLSAGIMAGLVGVLFGLPTIRVKGFYLVMTTLAAHFIISYVTMHWTNVTQGSMGYEVAHPSIFGFSFDTETTKFWLILVILIACTFLAKNLVRMRLGRAFIAVRDNDLAASIMGLNIGVVKLQAFFVCCFFAGIGGALFSVWNNSVEPQYFSLMTAIWYLGFIIVGGLGTITGAFFGTGALMLLREVISRFLPYVDPALVGYVVPFNDVLFGVIIALILIFEPRGMAHAWNMAKAYIRIWPLAY